MASPEELVHSVPETLPEDFSEWDGENSPAAPHAEGGELEGSRSFRAVSEPPAQSEQPQIWQPLFTAAPVAHELRNEPPSLPPSVYQDHEAHGGSLWASGAALKSEPLTASRGQSTAYATKEVAFEPVRTSSTPAYGVRNAPSLLPPTACADEEAFFNQLRAIGSVLNTQPIKPGHKPAFSRATDDVLFKPVVSNGSAERRFPTKPTTEEFSFKPVPSNGAAERQWPGKPTIEEVSFKPVPSDGSAEPQWPGKPTIEEFSFKPAPSNGAAEHQWPDQPTIKKFSFKPASSNGAAELRWHDEPIHVTATIGAAEAVATPSFLSDLDDLGDENSNLKKWIKVAAIGVVSILFMVFLGVRLLSPGKPTMAKQSVAPQPAADANPTTNTLKPSPSTHSGTSKLSAVTKTQPMIGGQPDTKAEDYLSPQVDSQQMNDQLTAPPRIPQQVKVKVKEEAPPPDGFSAVNSEGAGDAGAIGGVFGGQAQPKVAYVPYPMVTIAAGVADGLLTQRTRPVYPPNAWYDGITGKVELEATVSRTGWVEKLRFVSGSKEFRQAAMDAVKTWRYRPYMIDKVPREFQTTVSVTFDQNSAKNPLAVLHMGSHSKKESASLKSSGAGAP
jgi:TonB family protein